MMAAQGMTLLQKISRLMRFTPVAYAYFLTVLLYFTANFLSAQSRETEEVLMTVDGDPVTKEEFLNIYKKNNKDEKITQESLEEYLDLFINFKLKVKAAEDRGMDTLESFRKELSRYRDQLAEPYMTDQEKKKGLLREAYRRKKKEVRAKHILIKVPENAAPADTQAAYEEAVQAMERVREGDDFSKVAREFSDDPTVKRNGGDIGYFSVFDMVYPFESAAYETEEGAMSGPVRTKYGYHVIKVLDKRPSRGAIKVAHIMKQATQKQSEEKRKKARKKIRKIRKKIVDGERTFAEMARRNSDDRRSAKRGGELERFGSGDMVPKFEDAAFGLEKNGAISEPVKTRYGWHIIKRLDRYPIASYEDARDQLEKKLKKSDRYRLVQEAFTRELMQTYEHQTHPEKAKALTAELDSGFFQGGKELSPKDQWDETVLEIEDRSYSQLDLLKFIAGRQKKRPDGSMEAFVTDLLHQFLKDKLKEREKANLDEKYPEFRALLNEYRDGILLFELTDQKVWKKALKDTIGLEAYYEENKKSYMWDKRLDAKVYECTDRKHAGRVRKMLRKERADSIIRAQEGAKGKKVKIDRGKFQAQEEPWTDQVEWEPGISEPIPVDDKVVVVKVNKVLEPRPKTFKEAKGLVTSDYQEHLEEKWVEKLRDQYEVTVNENVLQTIR